MASWYVDLNQRQPMHVRHVDNQTLAPALQVNTKPTTINSLADTTLLANSPTHPLEPRSKAGLLFTYHTTFY
jgi:hypothetical protein